ncbi:hypothetical protein SOVF_166250 [Spinacia oleracea]|uniref:Trans-resveratrol di-O-methyltransferase n=1 Tax=Spinacia oleracea TaxID=3562 RepID=A0A9R0IFC7_SPIOL|nr:trans-resveratrol di-O-methyltransferase-like [Spinacia oleracea]KNA08044.1 hypothetical protein SOVF_166250 [Spinacia oleracea]
MDLTILGEVEENELLVDAQAHIWRNIFSFLNSMALKCALELSIPDAIKKHGKPMTLNELTNSLLIHPNKTPSLSRLMRILVSTNFFSNKILPGGEECFALTLSSQLLLKDHPLSQAAFSLAMLDPRLTNPSYHLSSWFRNDAESPFQIVNGRSFWEKAALEPKFNEFFNQAMESDSRFVTSFLVRNNVFKGLFEGVKSLVDVAGGNGTTAKAISEAFSWLKCTVFDLPHVVQGIQDRASNLNYVAGDMFDAIPHADAVLLKWILHDWSDKDCIKILQQCKEAIPNKNDGGKVIIIDMVVGPQTNNSKHSDAQLLFDMEMMSLTGGGKERTKEEWENIFVNAGFGQYKIFPFMGLRSVIEVYPL